MNQDDPEIPREEPLMGELLKTQADLLNKLHNAIEVLEGRLLKVSRSDDPNPCEESLKQAPIPPTLEIIRLSNCSLDDFIRRINSQLDNLEL